MITKSKLNKLLFSFLLFTFFIIGVCFVFSNNGVEAECTAGSDEYCLLEPIPLTDTNTTVDKTSITTYIPQMMRLIIALAGALAVIMLIWAGFQYITSDGFGKKSNAREKINTALLGLLLAIGSYAILYTINPEVLKLNLSLTPVPAGPSIDTKIPNTTTPPPTGTTTTNGTVLLCSPDQWQQIAVTNNEAYPARNSPELNTLISCINTKMAGRSLGSVYTYDQSYPVCNYTRGQRTCSTRCSHAVNSCHYGGRSGSAGALAVDFGAENWGNDIIAAANSCGAKSARCEDDSGNTVGCTSGSATHVHVNAGSCDAN